MDSNEQVDSCDLSKWRVMAGKLDWDKIADSIDYSVVANYGDGRDISVIDVTAGCGDHRVLIVRPDGSRIERIIPAEQVLPTARLFVSCMVRRHKTVTPPFMVIRPV